MNANASRDAIDGGAKQHGDDDLMFGMAKCYSGMYREEVRPHNTPPVTGLVNRYRWD